MGAAKPGNHLPSTVKPALDEILRRVGFRAEVFYRGQLCDAWALDTSGSGQVSFHLVRYADCWLHLPGGVAPVRLRDGDIVVLPHDSPHIIGSSPERPPAFGVKTWTQTVPIGNEHPGTGLICGFLDIDRGVRQLFLAALPEHLVIGREPGAGGASALLDLLFAEARADGVASSAILDRLADALLLYVVRDIVERELPARGLLGALGDPSVQKAALAICAEPGRRWTLDSLAGEACLSRSAFAERFFLACGMPPIEFLGLWRMYLARGWLEREKASVMEVAQRCGYESAAAFSKAFKRVMGVGPGQFRRIGAARGP